jgi:molecular chaperone Hsp33
MTRMSNNFSQRFIFDKADIRGDLVRLDTTYQDILSAQQYPEVVANLLGEFLVAGILLGATIKFKGRLILQVKSQGLIPLLMVEVTHDRKVRGIARTADELTTSDVEFDQLFLDGSMAVTIEPDEGERYQSLVPLDGDNLSICLEHYFAQSEQLNTSISLTAYEGRAAGMLLQQLPKQLIEDEAQREEQWQRASILGSTVKPDELVSLEPQSILWRLFSEDAIKLLPVDDVEFKCSCNAERTAGAMLALDPAELESIFEEDETIRVNCEFCQQDYEFTRESVAELVREGTTTH